MSSTNFAHLLHDVMAGRSVLPQAHQHQKGQNLDDSLRKLGEGMQHLIDAQRSANNDIQRAFRTLGGALGAQETVIITSFSVGTSSVTLGTARAYVLALDQVGTTILSGTNCT